MASLGRKKAKKKAAKAPPFVPRGKVDKARASKEGNRYHEAWLARRSLELIFPRDGLVAIAVEGLHDETGLSQEAIEIADATFYYGSVAFVESTAIQIEQFKFSVGKSTAPFRAADAAKTLKKFAKAEADLVAAHGKTATAKKIRYGITTNRPIYRPFSEAIMAASNNVSPTDAESKTQLTQLKAALGLSGPDLASFCKRLHLSGLGDTVTSVDGTTQRTIADWSASSDTLAMARVGSLRKLISEKAAIPGEQNKTLSKEDVLAAFNVGNEKDLLPTPDAFPDVGDIVERSQLDDLLSKLKSKQLVLIHASGGVGKTVFVQSAAKRLLATDEVVLFDCFGGGAYRIPTDGRHKPERGLMHIVNELAARGLCDPILPGSSDPMEVIRTAIRRFEQTIKVLRRSRPNARLVVILDAMDNSGVQADDLGERSFPRLLFETFSLGVIPDGLLFVGTCRPERTDKAIGAVSCFNYSLDGFTIAETTEFVKSRRPEATPEQIASIQYRSAANPRVIANLINPARALPTDKGKVAVLDDLIAEQISAAVNDAKTRGAQESAVNAFLCALARLPPPVPVDELAKAFGQPVAAIESFASDLSPLLDRNRHGLIFRDEPTETLVRKRYGGMTQLLSDVVARLKGAQDSSAYATRSLPGLLFAIEDVAGLQALAFDDRFPPALSSEAAKRTIRLNRLQVAVAAAARANDADAMTSLLAELSSVAVVNERGDDYFLSNPDLVMALGDADAVRRLYESRRGWFGARPSRLAIAAMLDGDIGEAHEEAIRSVDWLQWLYSKREDDSRSINPATNDFAAWGFYRLESEKFKSVANFVGWWVPEHGYEVAKRILELDWLARFLGKAKFKPDLDQSFALRPDCPAPYLAAFLDQRPFAKKTMRQSVITSLAKKLKAGKPIEKGYQYPDRGVAYRDSVLKAALEAASMGKSADAKSLRATIAARRYRWYQLRDRIAPDNFSGELLYVALQAALKGKPPTLFDCLPEEQSELVKGRACPPLVADQYKVVLAAIEKAAKQGPDPKVKPRISGSERYEWTDRLSTKLDPVMMACTAAYELITSKTSATRKKAVKNYFATWERARALVKKASYGSDRDLGGLDQYYLNTILVLTQALNLREAATATLLVNRLKDVKFKPPYILTKIIGQFSLHPNTQALAGTLAAEVIGVIGTMDDTSERSSSYADLARALLPADKVEAHQLFARGYGELNAIGSGDYELVNELLLFACQLGRAPLDPKSAHTLGKIIELNTPYESEKFPWALAASAFSVAWGIDYLAQIARWDDRDKIGLDWTIGSAVTKLIKSRAISVRVGLTLISLVDPVETHGWEIDELLETALERAPLDAANTASEFLDLLERKYSRSVPEREMSSFEAITKRIAPTALKAVSPRVADMRQRQKQEFMRDGEYSSPTDPKFARAYARQQKAEAKKALKLAKTTQVSTESFEALVQELNDLHGRLDLKKDAFELIRKGLHYSKRPIFVKAVVEAKNLELFTKIAILKDCKKAWLSQSPTGLSYFKGLGLRLAELHVKDILERDWGFLSLLNDLVELSGDTKVSIAIRLTQRAATQELKADATAWLSLGQIISVSAKPEVPRDALTRILSGEAARLAAGVGDGPWHVGLAAPTDENAAAAGLIWSALGSQNVYARWAAAHTVRRAAKLGLWKIIDELFILFAAKDAGPFQDRKLPFFQMHARLWLLIAIARIALDQPSKIVSYRPHFENVLNETVYPHPAIQDAAARALKATFANATVPPVTAALLAKTNVSPFPIAVKATRTLPYQRPSGTPKVDFNFEYDFNKYKIASVSSLFALPEWKVQDETATIVTSWDNTVTSMHEGKGKKPPPGDSYSRTDESFHSYGYYLGWHAVNVVAGLNLKANPIHQEPYQTNVWGDWLGRRQLTRTDGLWQSDGTDSFSRVAGISLKLNTDKEERPTGDIKTIKSIVGIAGNKVTRDFLIDGDWKSPDSVRVSVNSVLVSRPVAHDAAVAAVTGPIHHAWLPTFTHYENGDEDMRFGGNMAPLEPWIANLEAEYSFDDNDPYMSKYASKRSQVSKDVVADFSLVPEPLWRRTWSDAQDALALRSEAWGARNGLGRRDDFESGHSLVCTPAFLRKVLGQRNRDLLVLINLEHTKDYERYREMEDAQRYTRSLVALLIDKSLKVRVVTPTVAQMKAVAKLGQRYAPDFDRRYVAIKSPKVSTVIRSARKIIAKKRSKKI